VDAAELLASVRRRRGLTQAELAKRAGTSQPVVSAYEHRRRDPSISTLRRLVNASGERLVLDATSPEVERITNDDARSHGDRLFDLLSLVDALPLRRRVDRLVAPRIASR
jgi:hypothetical protein